MKRAIFVLIGYAAIFWPSLAIACSGRGAIELYQSNAQVAFWGYGVGAIFLLGGIIVQIKRHKKAGAWPLLALAFVLINWVVAPYFHGGDCGVVKAFLSVAIAIVLAIRFIFQLVKR